MSETNRPIRTTQMELIELQRGRPLSGIIKEEFEAGKSWREVAEGLGISTVTLRDWCERLGFQIVMRRVPESLDVTREVVEV